MRDDDFFLPRHERERLRDLLGQTIPALVEDLAITISRQDRVARPGLSKIHRGKPESAVPINFGAAGCLIELQNSIASAIRHVCEERGLEFMPLKCVDWEFVGPLAPGWKRVSSGYQASLLELSAWLKAHLVSFALTEGAGEYYQDIASATKAALRSVDLPLDDDVVIDRERVQAANRQVVTAEQAERIAARLGDLGHGLTAARVRTLRKKGHLRHVSVDPDSQALFYRLGDVLDAHHRVARRSRKNAS